MTYRRSRIFTALTAMLAATLTLPIPAVAAFEFSFVDPIDTPTGLDIVAVSAEWEPSTALTVEFTFDAVADEESFPNEAFAMVSLDTDLDGEADNLVHVGYVWGSEHFIATVCDRRPFEPVYDCSDSPDVEFFWVGPRLRIHLEDIPSIVFGERLDIRTAANLHDSVQQTDVWDLAPAFGFWTLYDWSGDTEAPLLSAPYDRFPVWPSSPDGAVVSSFGWLVVSDNLDPDPDLECTPPPGFFPIGDTLVTCTALDDAGNRSDPVSFTVHVLTLSEVAEGMAGLVASFPDRASAGMAAVLNAAARHLEADRTIQACHLFDAFETASVHAVEVPPWFAGAFDRMQTAVGCE